MQRCLFSIFRCLVGPPASKAHRLLSSTYKPHWRPARTGSSVDIQYAQLADATRVSDNEEAKLLWVDIVFVINQQTAWKGMSWLVQSISLWTVHLAWKGFEMSTRLYKMLGMVPYSMDSPIFFFDTPTMDYKMRLWGVDLAYAIRATVMMLWGCTSHTEL